MRNESQETQRQKIWRKAAEEAAQRGNLAAGLFALIAQPNREEIARREVKRQTRREWM